MTLAVAKWLLNDKNSKEELVRQLQFWGNKYPNGGYGRMFNNWLHTENPAPYGSWGNGSAMRVSPVAWVGESLEEVQKLAEASSVVTHNHPEGVKGALATADAIYLARLGSSKDEIREHILNNYYNIDFELDDIRDHYYFDVSCQGSVPQALQAFFEARDYEDTIRNAISIGGDSDTIAAIAGAVAGAYYGVPEEIKEKSVDFLTYRLQTIVDEVDNRIQEIQNGL
jgi:ADP-ribosylglycohydrolase